MTFRFFGTVSAAAIAVACLAMPHRAADTAAAVSQQARVLLDDLTDRSGPGAVILVARDDEVLFRGARGSAEIELGVALSPDDAFRIGSNTKPFTAATIMKLVDQHRLTLGDPISRFVPGYPNGDHITVDELLRHTSGIKDYTEIDGYFDSAIRQDVDTAKLIDVFRNLPVDFAPGTDWKYSNSGYILLGAIIEKVTGKPWYVAMRELVLAPVGLDRTAYDDGIALVQRRAAGYGVDASGRVANAPYISTTQAAAAGALVSTADDLFRWMRALHTGKVLQADSYRRMTSVVPTSSGRPTDYASGIGTLHVRGELAFEHVGRDPGYMSETLYLPRPAVSVVVLTNTDSPRADISVVAAKLAATAMDRPYPVRHPVALTSAQMQALVGDYRKGETTFRKIAVRDGHLVTQREGGGEHVLRASSSDELYFDGALDYFTVTRDASGNVVALEQFENGEAPPVHLSKPRDAAPPSER